MNTMLGVLVLAVSAGGPAAPLVADRPVIDRGTVKGGPPLREAFRLTAAVPVAITGIESGCGCVRYGVSKQELAAGVTADVAVEVNTLTQPDGPNTWRFTVKYRREGATADEQLDLRLAATLVREVTVTPPMMAVSTEGEATQDIVVRDARAKPLAVTGAATSAAFLTADVRPAAGGRTAVRVTVAADAPVGVHDAAVVIATSDPEYPELRVPVRVTRRAKAAVRVTPEAVDLRPAGGAAVAVVQLRGVDGRPVEVARAECATPGVVLKWSSGAGPAAAVRVELTTAAGRRGRAEVTITFAQPAEHRVSVPVSWSDE